MKTLWDDVRDEYGKMTQMGWQSVMQAAKVGKMLIALKAQCPQRSGEPSFEARFKSHMPGVSAKTRSTLMKLAVHLPLLEQHKPESQRAALALIPKDTKLPHKRKKSISKSSAVVTKPADLIAKRIIKELEGIQQAALTDAAWFAGQLHYHASRINPLHIPLRKQKVIR